MKQQFFLWTMALFLFASLLGVKAGYITYAEAGEDIKEKSIVVPVKKAEAQSFFLEKNYIGTVKDINAVSVLPYINGFIKEVKVKGGQKVKKGQVLFILKQDEYLAQMKLASANRAKAEADLANAKSYFERIKNTKSEAIAKTEMDNATAQFLAAEAGLKSALANEEIAKVNYNYTVIRATIDGVLGDVQITKGDYVSPEGQALAYILQYNPIRVVFSIPNKDYLQMKGEGDFFSGWQMNLLLADGLIYNEVGDMKFLNNQINPQTLSLSVYADFKNPDNQLVPNAYVNVLVNKKVNSGILLPKNNVYLEPKGTFVYVLADGIVKKVPVEIGSSIGNQYFIKSGVNSGDMIIQGSVNPLNIGKTAQGEVL